MRRLSNLLRLRPPKWDAVERNFNKEMKTRDFVIWSVVTAVTAIAMLTALIIPSNALVALFGRYGLACFLPMLVILLIRRWNRTFAFPAALIFTGIAVMSLVDNFNFNNAATTVFSALSFIIGAASDRLSPIYKWKPPLNYIGIIAGAALTFAVVFFTFVFLFGAVLLVIAGIALLAALFSAMSGRGRYSRWP